MDQITGQTGTLLLTLASVQSSEDSAGGQSPLFSAQTALAAAEVLAEHVEQVGSQLNDSILINKSNKARLITELKRGC